MSEPNPVWDIPVDGTTETGRILFYPSTGKIQIRDTGISVAELLRFVASSPGWGAVWEEYPELVSDDIDDALRLAAQLVELSESFGQSLARPRTVVSTNVSTEDDPEDDCYTDPPQASAAVRFMAFGAGGLMFALALLGLWFLLQQLWG